MIHVGCHEMGLEKGEFGQHCTALHWVKGVLAGLTREEKQGRKSWAFGQAQVQTRQDSFLMSSLRDSSPDYSCQQRLGLRMRGREMVGWLDGRDLPVGSVVVGRSGCRVVGQQLANHFAM